MPKLSQRQINKLAKGLLPYIQECMDAKSSSSRILHISPQVQNASMTEISTRKAAPHEGAVRREEHVG